MTMPLNCVNHFSGMMGEWKWWALSGVTAGEERRQALHQLRVCIKDQAEKLKVSHLNLTSLPQQWPHWIVELDMGHNDIKQLPSDLPPSLTILNIYNNKLQALPPLPPTLKILDVTDNLLRVLPDHLPPLLTVLNVGYNQLISLPAQLPDSLEQLHFFHNFVIKLPERLPERLFELDGAQNELTTLPDRLPSALHLLDLSCNQLTALPDRLPVALCKLVVHGNALMTLPEQLPDQLEELDVSYNKLSQLPENLPDSIRELDVSSNQLKQLPQRLPSSLFELNAGLNQLTQLPSVLPSGLQRLFVSDNALETLPDQLPNELKSLYVSYNKLTRLPDQLPASLVQLKVIKNALTVLPDHLPDSLSTLYVSHNYLVRLPEQLPASLQALYIDDNLITALPDQLPDGLIEFEVDPPLRFDPNHIDSDSFLHTIRRWSNNTTPWDAIRCQPSATSFMLFLQKLSSKTHLSDQLLKQRVAHLLDYLADAENSALRERLFLVADEASGDCVDRAAFYFNQMYLAVLEHQLMSSNLSVTDLFCINLGLFRLQLLEKLAANRVAKIKRQYPDYNEDIQTYLAYQCQLSEPLSLPIYTTLHYGEVDSLTEQELHMAVSFVLDQETQHFIRYLVTESSSWYERITQWDKAQVQAVEAAYLAAIESDAFSQRIDAILVKEGIAIEDVDARRVVEKQHADQMLYQRRYQLTYLFLAAHQSIDLLSKFNHPEQETPLIGR